MSSAAAVPTRCILGECMPCIPSHFFARTCCSYLHHTLSRCIQRTHRSGQLTNYPAVWHVIRVLSGQSNNLFFNDLIGASLIEWRDDTELIQNNRWTQITTARLSTISRAAYQQSLKVHPSIGPNRPPASHEAALIPRDTNADCSSEQGSITIRSFDPAEVSVHWVTERVSGKV